MSALNAGCVDLALLQQVIGNTILGFTANNTLQVGLLDCHGNPLGKASVPSCDQMSAAIDAATATLEASGVRVSHDDTLQGDGTTANPLKVNVCGIMTSVVHDSTLSGYGTCQSPLTVNTSWLEAFVLNLADTQALIHIAPDSGISGDGTTANPLALNVQHDTSMYGLGTKASPLGVDTTWLDTQIDNEIDAHGIHTASGGGLAGNGTTGSPLSLTINHDSSLDGLGTSGSPLTVDTGWLDTQIKNYISANPLAPTAGAAPATIVENGTISTNIVGGQTQTLGAPEGWAALGNGYMVPLYKAAA